MTAKAKASPRKKLRVPKLPPVTKEVQWPVSWAHFTWGCHCFYVEPFLAALRAPRMHLLIYIYIYISRHVQICRCRLDPDVIFSCLARSPYAERILPVSWTGCSHGGAGQSSELASSIQILLSLRCGRGSKVKLKASKGEIQLQWPSAKTRNPTPLSVSYVMSSWHAVSQSGAYYEAGGSSTDSSICRLVRGILVPRLSPLRKCCWKWAMLI